MPQELFGKASKCRNKKHKEKRKFNRKNGKVTLQ